MRANTALQLQNAEWTVEALRLAKELGCRRFVGAGSIMEHETMAEDEERYFLVAEEGYLIVYDKGKETTDLFTHMPLAEFPEEEQERLMTGIWFPTMAEIFSYLESYSS